MERSSLPDRGDTQKLAGYVVEQVIDEFDRPVNTDYEAARVPPSEDDTELLCQVRWADVV